MNKVKKSLIVALLLLFAIFFIQNSQAVAVQFLFWKTEASRALVLAITFLGGLFTGWSLNVMKPIRKHNARTIVEDQRKHPVE